MIGPALTVTQGRGPRADATEAVRALLRVGDVQLRLEQQTPWSPVAIGTAPLNADHRDIVRWFTGSGAYVVVDAETAAHPLFQALHLALR
jgi:hypothetical protein